jgi:hypothetical protein
MADGEAAASDSDASKVNPADFMPPPPPANFRALKGAVNRTLKKLDGVCLRTTLDLEACRKVAADTTAKKEEQKEIVLTAPSEAFKKISPIADYKNAAPCRAQWEDMSGTEAFRICRQCGLHVYNFAGIDVADAKELVIKREGKENQSFYRRKDGKFLTSNCPVGVKQSMTTAGLITAGVLVAIIAIAIAVLAPPPRPVVISTPNDARPAESDSVAPQTVHAAIGAMKTTAATPARSSGPSNVLRQGTIRLGPTPQPEIQPELPAATEIPSQSAKGTIPENTFQPNELVGPPAAETRVAPVTTNDTSYTTQTQLAAPAQSSTGQAQQPASETPQPSGNPYVKEYR